LGLSDSRSAGVLRAVAHGASLVVELSRRYLPAFARFPNDGVVTDVDIVEKLLAEFDRSVDLLDAVDGYSGMSKRYQEHRQAVVFGYVPIGPGQA
jgi:hypothetical protein